MAHSEMAPPRVVLTLLVLAVLCLVVVVCRYMTDGVMLRESMRVR